MQLPQPEQMQYMIMPMMPMMVQPWPQGFGQQPMYFPAFNMPEIQMQQMPPYPQYNGQQQLPTCTGNTPASPGPHQAPVQHHGMTGEQTGLSGLPLEQPSSRGDEDENIREAEDEDIRDIGACRPV